MSNLTNFKWYYSQIGHAKINMEHLTHAWTTQMIKNKHFDMDYHVKYDMKVNFEFHILIFCL